MDFSLTPLEQELQKRVRRLAEEQIAPIAAEADESGLVHRRMRAVLHHVH